MAVTAPFNLKKWIDEHRDMLKPPVGNQCVYKDAENFIVMVVGGPNARKDYHFNETEELYYQIEGDIVVRIIDNGEFKDIRVKEGEMFLLPPKTPHSPLQRARSRSRFGNLRSRGTKRTSLTRHCPPCRVETSTWVWPMRSAPPSITPNTARPSQLH